MTRIGIYLHDHLDTICTIAVGSSGFGLLMTDLDLILKVLIGFATLTYLGLKITFELKKRKK